MKLAIKALTHITQHVLTSRGLLSGQLCLLLSYGQHVAMLVGQHHRCSAALQALNCLPNACQ